VKAAGITHEPASQSAAITQSIYGVEGQGYDRNANYSCGRDDGECGLFSLLGIPLIKGRFFSPSDRVERDKDPMIVIINLTMANQYFGGNDPIGAGFRQVTLTQPLRGKTDRG